MTTAPLTNRRTLLKLLGASAVAPLILPLRLFGADAPSGKITLGCIGVGWQGGGNLNAFLAQEVVIAGGYCEIQGGAKWIGPNGWVRVTRGMIDASDKQWIRDIQDREKKGALDVTLYKSPGHQKEFIDSVKSRKRTLTPVEIAHRSQMPGHLGYIASVVGRKLKWDAAKQEIIGDAEASKLLSKQMREPWHLWGAQAKWGRNCKLSAKASLNHNLALNLNPVFRGD